MTIKRRQVGTVVNKITDLLPLRLSSNYLGSAIFVIDLHFSRFSTYPICTHQQPSYHSRHSIQPSLFSSSSSCFPSNVYFRNYTLNALLFPIGYHMSKPSQSIFSRLVHYRCYTNITTSHAFNLFTKNADNDG